MEAQVREMDQRPFLASCFPYQYLRASFLISLPLRLCAYLYCSVLQVHLGYMNLPLFFLLIRQKIFDRVGVARGRIQSAQEFALDILSEASPLAATLNHLVSDVLGRGRHEVVGLEG